MLLLQFFLFLLVTGAVVAAYRRLAHDHRDSILPGRGLIDRLRTGVSWPAANELGDEPHYADLTLSMFNSVANPRRARASDGQIVIGGISYVAVASPRDASLIYANLAFFGQDLNQLVQINRGPRKLKSSSPLDINHVICDETVPDGEPYLVTVADARARKLKVEEDQRKRETQRVQQHFAADALGGEQHGHDGPAIWNPSDADPGTLDRAAVRVSRVAAIAGTLIPNTPGLHAITVTAPGLKLGRGPHHSQGTVDVTTVSWDHAEITPIPNRSSWQIVDLESSNGTRVNGQVITRHTLVDGDVINLGKDTEFTWSAHPAAYTPTGK